MVALCETEVGQVTPQGEVWTGRVSPALMHTVDIVTLGTVVEGPIALVKLDCEGCELELRANPDAWQDLRARTGALVGEFHHTNESLGTATFTTWDRFDRLYHGCSLSEFDPCPMA